MTETEMTPVTETPYDPVPDLARLLCAAQRQGNPLPGLEFVLSHLMQGLDLPPLAYSDEAEVAVREALEAHASVTRGDVITIVPERGPSCRMLVAHVEHHIITLADLDSRDNGEPESGQTSTDSIWFQGGICATCGKPVPGGGHRDGCTGLVPGSEYRIDSRDGQESES